jgi:hypothetical protein
MPLDLTLLQFIQVDYDGTQVIREVTITKIPPILQIHVQVRQFYRS